MSAVQRPKWRDQVITSVIAFIMSLYGVALVQSSHLMLDLSGGEGTVGATILITGFVFLLLGAYSAAVVTSNSFATIVAGRVREIAQYRLLGASASMLRRRLAVEGTLAGVAGAVGGMAVGVAGYIVLLQWLIGEGHLPGGLEHYTLASVGILVPALISVATVAVAAWIGTRPVTRVSPVQALSTSVEAPIGETAPMGLPVAFFGGMASFTGFVIGARMLVPRLLRLVGRAFGGGVPARLATANAVRSPRAATRGTIGMIVGVTLVVMFVVAAAILRVVATEFAGASEDPMLIEAMNILLDVITWIAVALVGVSAVIGAAGMIANLSLGVLQRQREFGLLRAVGATAGQVRASIGLEAVVTSLVAIGTGFVLGTAYGWLAAQATVGSLAGGLVPLVVPWWLLAGVGGSALVLAAVTALAPALRATSVTPIQALAVQ